MRKFKKVVNEIVYSLDGVLILPLLLNATILFLALFLIMALLKYSALIAYVISILYLLYASYKRMKTDKIKLVELVYPDLNEKLRTARDYAEQDGELIDELHKEVASDLRYVESASFLDTRKLTGKIFLCIFLCFLIIFMSSLSLDPTNFKNDMKDRVNKAQQIFSGESIDQDIKSSSTTNAKGSPDIYGDPSVAKLGDKSIDVKIAPSTYEFNVRNIRDAEEKQFDSVFPQDIAFEQTSSYEENIPKDQQELVKNYFRKLTEN